MNALSKAIEISGGQTALAKRLGTSAQVVNNWVRRGSVPPGHAPAIEAATNGAVKAEELCPGVPWHVIRGQPGTAQTLSEETPCARHDVVHGVSP